MENKSSQRVKVPLIFIGVAVLVISVGVMVRLRNSPSSPPVLAEPEPALATLPAPEPAELATAPAPALTREPAPVSAPSPEPTQEIVFASLAVKDSSGDDWYLALAGVPPQARDSGKKPGAPLSVKADVQGHGQSISIGLIIEGHAGEVYGPGAAKNGRKRPAPKFTVFDETGTVLGSGSFEYG